MMQQAETMAIKITRKTWPIATACLAKGFARIPFGDVRGRYLVINEIVVRNIKKVPVATISNGWMHKDHFDEVYEFIGKEKKGQFTLVRPKA
jgi:hypothetical protein